MEIRTLPIVAIRGSVVFPHTDAILSFGRPKSIAAINAAFQESRVFGIFAQKKSSNPDPSFGELFEVGTLATITQMMANEGEIHAMVRGQCRINFKEGLSHEPYLVAKVEELEEKDVQDAEVEALTNHIIELFRKSINLGKPVEVNTVMKLLSRQAGSIEVIDSVSSLLDIPWREKQALLENLSVRSRAEIVLDSLSSEVREIEIEKSISQKTHKRFEDQMRKAMLREKKRTIEQELGEADPEDLDDLAEYDQKIKKAKLPKEVKEKVEKELKRLKQLSPHSPEGGYIRGYVDWLLSLPWSKSSKSTISVKEAEKILEEDHYGLGKVKERILEHLSVLKLKESTKDGVNHPTILCFVGPPGVGKTSIGRSIAKAMGREFVRASLGGIRDEAEIRGHRRTYVGSMPGRIIQSIKNAGTNNPVFMLDEIDKLGNDYRGDPSSALLEILDPEQNKEYSDHYVEIPFDLSNVMFIATANVLDSIPLPLRDRMEIIRFTGYTEDEKFHISKKYLWPKQLKVHGLYQKNIKISDKAMRFAIRSYTRESGVRELERVLATITRKIARMIAERKKHPSTIKVSDVLKFLGPIRFRSVLVEEQDSVGMSTGLAYMPTGGEIIFIEAALMPGRGNLTLTGQLGDIMQESAKASFTWAKSNWEALGLPEGFGRKIDVHIHVPEGAIPKDGPSAGVAITTALVSALTGTPVRRDVGMTGEVTLRGRVLEIGGVKEKTIAGHTAGLKKIVLPKNNKKDLEDVPANVKKDVKFVFANDVKDVLKEALIAWPIKTEEREEGKRVIPTAPSFLARA